MGTTRCSVLPLKLILIASLWRDLISHYIALRLVGSNPKPNSNWLEQTFSNLVWFVIVPSKLEIWKFWHLSFDFLFKFLANLSRKKFVKGRVSKFPIYLGQILPGLKRFGLEYTWSNRLDSNGLDLTQINWNWLTLIDDYIVQIDFTWLSPVAIVILICKQGICKSGILKHPIFNVLNFRGWIKLIFDKVD